jgi:hypothetical protein
MPEPSNGPGRRDRVSGFMSSGELKKLKALDLLPALIRLVAQQRPEVESSSKLQTQVLRRLEHIQQHPASYYFGPADRLMPWVAPETLSADPAMRSTVVTPVLTTVWDPNGPSRRTRLSAILTELVKANKRVLLIASDERALDDLLLAAAKGLRGAGLQYRSFLCRYEPPTISGDGGINLHELSFERQVAEFLGKSQADKAGLRRKLTRYLELSPLLRYKADKQKDLDEVRHLEWRLLSALGDVQAGIKRLEQSLAIYDSLPMWHRLGMQVVGSNVTTMQENCALYEAQKQDYLQELQIVQTRINELKPEAYVDPEIRPEYDELKSEIERLGGVEKVHEVIATEENMTRRPFLQTKRVIASTATLVATNAIFETLRYDALLVDDAPRVALALLFICACMARERIILGGDPQELPSPTPTPCGLRLGWATKVAAPVHVPGSER